MEDFDNSLIDAWIYSYLRYYEAVTPEQRERSKKDFLALMMENADGYKEEDRIIAEYEKAQKQNAE